MENMSFNNKNAEETYFLKNFMKDFIHKPPTISCDAKSENQKDFERYLTEKRLVVVDYARIVLDQKYFATLTHYVNSTNKKTILYSSKDLSYISPTCIFYKFNIPKKPTIKQFENIYNYLMIHDNNRRCFSCGKNEPFYYCINCGNYFCRACVYTNLKVVDWGNDDIYYIICKSCSHHNTLYIMPSRFDF